MKSLQGSARNKELRIGGDASVLDFDDIDELSHYRGAGDARVHLGAPMHGRLRAVDQHGKNALLTQLEALDHDGEQGTELRDSHGLHRNGACGAAGAGDLKVGVIREGGAHRSKIAAHPRSIEFEQQAFDLDSLRHSVILPVPDN